MADETSWAAALWVKYGRVEAILLSSRCAARHTLLMCCCIDSVWSRWTPRFLTEDLNGIRLPPMSALSLPTELRWEADATGRTLVFSAFELVAVHPVYKTFDAGLDITEKRLKLIGRSPLWQLGTLSVFVINHTHGDISSQSRAESGLWHGARIIWPTTVKLWNIEISFCILTSGQPHGNQWVESAWFY